MSNTMNTALSTTRSTRRGPLRTTAIIGVAVASLFGATAPVAIDALKALPGSEGVVATASVTPVSAEAATHVQPMIHQR